MNASVTKCPATAASKATRAIRLRSYAFLVNAAGKDPVTLPYVQRLLYCIATA